MFDSNMRIKGDGHSRSTRPQTAAGLSRVSTWIPTGYRHDLSRASLITLSGRFSRTVEGAGTRPEGSSGEGFGSVPLVIKEPVLLSAEEPLDVESQRRRGSDSSTKKPLLFSSGEGSTVRRVEFSSFGLGLGMGLGLSGLGLIGRASLSASSCGREQQKECV